MGANRIRELLLYHPVDGGFRERPGKGRRQRNGAEHISQGARTDEEDSWWLGHVGFWVA